MNNRITRSMLKALFALALLAACFFSWAPGASAHTALPTTAAHTALPQSCGWVRRSDAPSYGSNALLGESGTVELILWENTCTLYAHCEINSITYNGGVEFGIDDGYENRETVFGGISPGYYLNTDGYYDRGSTYGWYCWWKPN